MREHTGWFPRFDGSTSGRARDAARKRLLLAVLTLMLGCSPQPTGVRHEEGQAAMAHRDHAAALNQSRAAAERGDARAQYAVGLIYEDGRGVKQDFREAVRWYRLAAAQGEWKAQTGLAWMYAIGEGVPQDYVRAHVWFAFAAVSASGHDAAMQAHLRDELARKMTDAQLAEAREMARRCQQSDFKDCD